MERITFTGEMETLLIPFYGKARKIVRSYFYGKNARRILVYEIREAE